VINAHHVFADLQARQLCSVLDEICARRGVLVHEVCGRARSLSVVRARHELWWTIRNLPGRHYSYPEIARLFRRDHTTVRYGIESHHRRNQP